MGSLESGAQSSCTLLRNLLTCFHLFLAERTIHWFLVAQALLMKKERCRYGNDNEKRLVAMQEVHRVI